MCTARGSVLWIALHYWVRFVFESIAIHRSLRMVLLVSDLLVSVRLSDHTRFDVAVGN
jgi:hypothetical protein